MLKGRNWAFLMYPESMPDDWFNLLQQTGLPFAISPLHDKDVNSDGTIKKPHYHLLLYYDNPTTQNSVKSLVCDLVHGTLPIKLESLQGMYRYHIHLDNPDKYQYDDKDRQFINGFDIRRVNSLTYSEIQKSLRQIQNFIIENSIIEYSELLDILLYNDLFQLWDVASNHTILLNTYITSRRFKSLQQKNKDCNK